MIRLKLEDVNAWLAANPRFSEDDHNLKLLAESPVIIDSTEKLTAFINQNPDNFHWLAEKSKVQHFVDNRRVDREEEDAKTKEKATFAKDEKEGKAREVSYAVERQKFYSLAGDTVNGRTNHAETARLRREFSSHLLINFPDMAQQIRAEFAEYLK